MKQLSAQIEDYVQMSPRRQASLTAGLCRPGSPATDRSEKAEALYSQQVCTASSQLIEVSALPLATRALLLQSSPSIVRWYGLLLLNGNHLQDVICAQGW